MTANLLSDALEKKAKELVAKANVGYLPGDERNPYQMATLTVAQSLEEVATAVRENSSPCGGEPIAFETAAMRDARQFDEMLAAKAAEAKAKPIRLTFIPKTGADGLTYVQPVCAETGREIDLITDARVESPMGEASSMTFTVVLNAAVRP
jgi:hypothetical protein